MKSFIHKAIPGAATLALVAPSLVAAQTTAGDAIKTVSDLLNMAVPIILTLAIIYFMWGLLMYLMKAGEDKDKARDQMIWGIIAIAVMVSIWGLVGILQSTFGIQGQNTPIVPATVQLEQN